jgi:hypothetical protein
MSVMIPPAMRAWITPVQTRISPTNRVKCWGCSFARVDPCGRPVGIIKENNLSMIAVITGPQQQTTLIGS